AAQMVSAAPQSPMSNAADLGMNQRPRIFEILRANGRRRPMSERANRTGRIVAGILRESAGALDEQIGHVPALQIFVERAIPRIVTHDRAAAEMRGLIIGHIVGP